MSQSPRFKSWPGSIIFPLILQKVVYSLVANTEEFSLKKIFIQKIVFPIVHTLNISASDTAYKYLLTAFSPAWYMSIYSRKSSSNKLKVISNFSLLHKLDLRQHAVGKNYLDVCVCVSCVLRQWSFIICVHACTHMHACVRSVVLMPNHQTIVVLTRVTITILQEWKGAYKSCIYQLGNIADKIWGNNIRFGPRMMFCWCNKSHCINL